jgi:hypothetical protein
VSIDPGSTSFDHYTVTRWHGGGTGHHGIVCYKADHDLNGTMSGLNLENLFNERFPEGTRLKVTVEIVEKGEGFGDPYFHRKNDYKGECKLCPPRETNDD